MNIGYFVLTLVLSLLFTPAVYYAMYKLRIVDHPRAAKRKIHKKKVPLGGGLAVFLSFFIAVYVAYVYGDVASATDVTARHLLALGLGGVVLMIGGFLDDKYSLAPSKQIIFPIVATLIVIAGGIGPHAISSPFGGTFDLTTWQVSVGSLGTFVLLADAIVFVWLMGMMFTTKFLDGLDGLVTGIVLIGSLVLFGFSTQPAWYQPDVALLAIMFAGACAGFLMWNMHPAKIFLGEGGSLFLGFTLGVLAIVSGAKIAVTLLVMAVPAIDVARVIIRRVQKGKSIVQGDNEHLHFKLIDSGLSHNQAVWLMYAFSGAIGLSALYLESTQKMIALLVILGAMAGLGFWFAKMDSQNTVEESEA